MAEINWRILEIADVPDSFVNRVKILTDGKGDRHLAQLLWQRNLHDENELAGFLSPDAYEPTSAFDFGQEMKWAMQRLMQARIKGEKIAIWGDFDADGVTATSVLWDGLGQFFRQESQLKYYVPNRLTESHGLNNAGIDWLRDWGANLIVTCDTGSTNLTEIAHAKSLGIDIIVTDHHTLPEDRPDVLAIINSRYFAETHPLYHLSGVAVAYKLIEALYATLPDIPSQPITNLLDLVAIGLIADLVALKGDCRYLAQMGIRQLQKQLNPQTVVHPGIKCLLEACRKIGDRPTDISFGIGPRINAISRIHGEASFCVELLTSRNLKRCQELAQQAELANTRRKEIQNTVVQQAKKQAEKLDLSTTSVLVLCDRQWQGGVLVLGLVANQVAQEFGRPTILLSYDRDQNLWKGSARSVQGIDLYELVHSQAHLLHRFGGHPFAAGLSLKPENLELFQMGINQKTRQYLDNAAPLGSQFTVDLVVDVGELGKELFQSLRCIEPCGMGNPVPKLLVKNCTINVTGFNKLKDKFNRKLNYYKTDFTLWDNTGEIDGICWGKHPDDVLQGNGLDVLVELDYSSFGKEGKYFVRLLAHCKTDPIEIDSTDNSLKESTIQILLDYRQKSPSEIEPQKYIIHSDCPVTWQDLHPNYQRAIDATKPLALAYHSSPEENIDQSLKTLIGIAKYLVKSQKTVALQILQKKLGCGEKALQSGLDALTHFGFSYEIKAEQIQIFQIEIQENIEKIKEFQAIFSEEQFQKNYFCDVPVSVIQQTLQITTS